MFNFIQYIICTLIFTIFIINEIESFQNVDCSSFHDCNSCTNTNGCGWYADTSSSSSTTVDDYNFTCVEGDEYNCFDKKCSESHLYFYDYCSVDVDSVILKRRSIRKYLDVQISKNVIEKIIENGIWAPNCMDYQPMEFYVIQEKELLKNISKHAEVGIDIFYDAPTVIFVFTKPKLGCGSMEGIDSGLAIQNMELTAYNMGLSTCTIGLARNAEKYIREVVGATESQHFIIAVTLGHPKQKVEKTRKAPFIKYV